MTPILTGSKWIPDLPEGFLHPLSVDFERPCRQYARPMMNATYMPQGGFDSKNSRAHGAQNDL